MTKFRRGLPISLLTAATAVLLSCDDSTGPNPPASVQVISGDGQEASAGSQVPDPLVVRVTDANGNLLSGVDVAWEISSGGGTITPTNTTTNSSGNAAATWTLGTAAGVHEAEAVVEGVPPATFTAQAVPGAAASVSIEEDSLVFTALADSVLLIAFVSDEYGNSIPDTVNWTSADESVAAIDDAGWVKAAGEGTTKLRATTGVASDSVIVEVDQLVRTIQSQQDTLTGLPGDTLIITAQGFDGNGYVVPNASFTIQSSDSLVAKPLETLKVEMVNWGTADIRLSADSASLSIVAAVDFAWRQLEQQSGSDIWSIWIHNSTQVFASHGNGMISSYGSEGNSLIQTECPYGAWSIWSAAGAESYGAGWRSCLMTFDGGTWSHEYILDTSDLFDVWGTSASNVYLAAIYGVWQYDGSTWTKQDLPSNVPSVPWLRTVWASSAGNVWAGGRDGVLVRWDGTQWTSVSAGTFSTITNIWGAAADSMYVAADVVRLWDGSDWISLDIPVPSSYGSSTAAAGDGYFYVNSSGVYYLRGTDVTKLPNAPGGLTLDYDPDYGLVVGQSGGIVFRGLR